jgi:hypothetical protein
MIPVARSTRRIAGAGRVCATSITRFDRNSIAVGEMPTRVAKVFALVDELRGSQAERPRGARPIYFTFRAVPWFEADA